MKDRYKNYPLLITSDEPPWPDWAQLDNKTSADPSIMGGFDALMACPATLIG